MRLKTKRSGKCEKEARKGGYYIERNFVLFTGHLILIEQRNMEGYYLLDIS
jgi:hypothetical protein